MAQTVNIYDVAKAAQVSPSTVSRILNGTARVSLEKQTRVQNAIEALNFEPNIIAKGLKRGRTFAIGVLSQHFSSTYHGEQLEGIEDGLQGTAYHPVIISARSSRTSRTDERRTFEALTEHYVDALIVLSGSLSDDELRKIAARKPLVITNRIVPGLEDRCLTIDNVRGGNLATRHLLSLGHRRIAHIGGPIGRSNCDNRLEGYKNALKEFGVPYDPNLVVRNAIQEHEGVLAAQHLLARATNFSAIFCVNDNTASGVQLALHQHGLRIPDDVSLVGFDDLYPTRFMTPPLTTVRQHVRQIGHSAARAVIDLLEGQVIQFKSPEPELVIRESTAAARVNP
jgi:LacI family transcriptional regulator